MGSARSARQRGFTIVELVVTLIVIGILAAIAIPRFTEPLGFQTLGFHDQILAAVQFARKSAVAQRRTACVDIDGVTGTLTLTIATAPGAAAACDRALDFPASRGALGANQVGPPAGVTVSAASLRFDSLGRPVGVASNVSITVTGDTARLVTVERDTGYAH